MKQVREDEKGDNKMKTSASYKTKIDIENLLDNPDACLVHDILSHTGASVLIPSKVPIGRLAEGLDNPRKMIETLDRMGIRKVEIMIPQEIDENEMMTRVKELDPSAVVVDNEVTRKARNVMSDIFDQASINAKFSIPRDIVNEVAGSISDEVMKTSQIALSMVSGGLDSYTKDHAVNVSMLSGYIARKLADSGKMPSALVEKTVQAGLLFDVGKTAVPREILDKKGRLTSEEEAIMRHHVLDSVSICKASGITDKDILEGIATHHERYDGSGYLKGLVGTRIPIIGRILAVADTFDAMTSPRVYKDAVSCKISFNFIMSSDETKFDPDICRVFMMGMGIYPPGAIVELSDGRVGTVAAVTLGNLLQPKVTVKGDDGQQSVIDLSSEKLFIRRSLEEDKKDPVDVLAMM
jgi:HD-GYP domain-containing protein (c-di-GMP phosphodiesterase class II)